MKYWEENERHDVEFNVGDLVFVGLSNEQFKPLIKMYSLVAWRFEGMVKVLERIKYVTYKLGYHWN